MLLVPPTNFEKILVWLDRLNLVIVDSSVHGPRVLVFKFSFPSLSISYTGAGRLL